MQRRGGYPGVPNFTEVTQETHQSCGPFKTQFLENLKQWSDARIMADLSKSLSPWLIGLTVFGGMEPMSKVVVFPRSKIVKCGRTLAPLLSLKHACKTTTKSA